VEAVNDSFLKIDEFALDKEWIEQPRLYFEWAKREADARRDWDDAKNNLEVVKSEVSLEIRQDPVSAGFEKLTEKIVEAAIVQDERHAAAVQRVNKTKHRHEVAGAMVRALEHKKAALGKLVDLHGMSYYAEPRTKANREEVEEMKKDRAWKPKEKRIKRGEDDD
jgi:hypothetical protein